MPLNGLLIKELMMEVFLIAVVEVGVQVEVVK